MTGDGRFRLPHDGASVDIVGVSEQLDIHDRTYPLSTLFTEHAAVDHDHFTGDIGGLIRGQKRGYRGYFIW